MQSTEKAEDGEKEDDDGEKEGSKLKELRREERKEERGRAPGAVEEAEEEEEEDEEEEEKAGEEWKSGSVTKEEGSKHPTPGPYTSGEEEEEEDEEEEELEDGTEEEDGSNGLVPWKEGGGSREIADMVASFIKYFFFVLYLSLLSR